MSDEHIQVARTNPSLMNISMFDKQTQVDRLKPKLDENMLVERTPTS